MCFTVVLAYNTLKSQPTASFIVFFWGVTIACGLWAVATGKLVTGKF